MNALPCAEHIRKPQHYAFRFTSFVHSCIAVVTGATFTTHDGIGSPVFGSRSDANVTCSRVRWIARVLLFVSPQGEPGFDASGTVVIQ